MVTQNEAQILALELLEVMDELDQHVITRCWESKFGFQFQVEGPGRSCLVNISHDGVESFGSYTKLDALDRPLETFHKNQPRAPKGSPNGGQWIKQGGGGSNGVHVGGRNGGADGDVSQDSQPGAGVSGGSSTSRRLQLRGADGKVRTVKPIGVIRAPKEREQALQALGLPTPEFYELGPADADVFRSAIASLVEGNPWAASVEVKSLEDYQNMRLFISDDGKLGGALDGDNIVSGFSMAGGKYKGGQRALIAARIAAGGRRSDSFDTILPHSYAQEGLTVVSRVGWNDEYAPEGWDKSQYAKWNNGEPDVVLYAYDPSKIGVPYEAGQGQSFDDWDDAAAVVDDYLAKT